MDKQKRQSAYSRKQDFSFIIPYQFLLLCRLMQVPPEKVLYDFMCNAGQEKYGLGDEQRAKAMEYFMQCSYGKDFYSEQDIRQIFKELEAVGSLFPNGAKTQWIDFHSHWRDKYYGYWFKKWWYKIRRRK